MKAALIQHAARPDRETALAYLRERIAEAARGGAELILLQELHNGPYFCQQASVAAFDRAETVPGPSTEALGRLARDHAVVIVGSLFETRAVGLHHNTAVVLDADGRLAGSYRKMHIPDDPGFYEKFYFTPGDANERQGFEPVDTQIGRLGVLVCWDQWFPEAARLMALAGAQLLLYPTAIGWDPRDDAAERQRQCEAWQTIQRAHAIANGLPVLACNRVGHEPDPGEQTAGIRFWGGSFAVGPQGEWLARADEAETLLYADLDLGRGESVRRIWPFLRDRRIDAYGDLIRRFRD